VAIQHLERATSERIALPRVVVNSLDRQFEALSRIGNRGHQVLGADRYTGKIGRKRRAGRSCSRGKARDLRRLRPPARVHDVWLDHIEGAHGDDALPYRRVPILFAADHIDVKSVSHRAHGLKVPLGNRLFVVAEVLLRKSCEGFISGIQRDSWRLCADPHPPPPAYNTRTWPSYNEALKRPGSLTMHWPVGDCLQSP
jgi:hypothetical protein